MKNPNLSIIIPCYNVENYLNECLESIINQTYNNYEIILVDDCSNDNTLNIIKSYAKKYTFIKTIYNKENKGAAYSRNEALKIANGKYISFIDSDDYIPNNYFELMLNKISLDKSDICLCDIKIIYPEGNYEVIKSVVGEVNSLNAINTGLAASPCNKVIKKELLANYEFPVGRINEDIAVIIPVLANASKISYVEDLYYNYIQHKSSVQNTSFSNKKFDVFYTLKLALDKIENNFDDIKDALVFNQLILLYFYIITKEKSFFKRIFILRTYHKLVKEYNILANTNLNTFLNNQGLLHRYYYKFLLKFNKYNLNILASLLIMFDHLYQKYFIRNVIGKNITMKDLIKASLKQSKLKESSIKLSVVVPNYNYEKFLFERIYSILNQKEKIFELIILDDCSKDNSRQEIDLIFDKLKDYINIKKVYNELNSGSAFKQWEKGFNLAEGNYVWIAEADDYSNKRFLKKVLKPIKKDDKVVISYTDTAFIDKNGKIIMRSVKSDIDLMHTGHWNKSYINTGMDEFNNYTFLNCTIANVSSCIFKNDNYQKYFKISKNYKQAGDWLFYANVMHEGNVAYCNKTLNYYRVHGNNVSSVTKKAEHMNEIKSIHSYYDDTYKLNIEQKKAIEKRYEFLRNVWNLNNTKK